MDAGRRTSTGLIDDDAPSLKPKVREEHRGRVIEEERRDVLTSEATHPPTHSFINKPVSQTGPTFPAAPDERLRKNRSRFDRASRHVVSCAPTGPQFVVSVSCDSLARRPPLVRSSTQTMDT